jgi:hypothetical protein
MNAKTRERHDRDRMPRQALLKTFRSIRVFNLPHGQTVIASDSIVYKADVRLSSIRALVLKSVF